MHNKNTTASGAADDSLLLCASDLQHSAIYDNPHEMVDCVRAVADRITALAASAPVAPTPPGYALVPLKVPASLYPRLTGYEKPAPGDHHSDHDRQEIESRSAKAWGEIVQAASTQPSTHARNDALADEIVELLDSCECLENGQKENALAIVKRMCSAQFEHSEAQ